MSGTDVLFIPNRAIKERTLILCLSSRVANTSQRRSVRICQSNDRIINLHNTSEWKTRLSQGVFLIRYCCVQLQIFVATQGCFRGYKSIQSWMKHFPATLVAAAATRCPSVSSHLQDILRSALQIAYNYIAGEKQMIIHEQSSSSKDLKQVNYQSIISVYVWNTIYMVFSIRGSTFNVFAQI